MQEPQGALLVWFGQAQSEDARYLSAWRDAALTYAPDMPLDSTWNVDRYEVILGNDQTGALFERAANLVLRNKFYPAEVMTSVSDFGLEDRPLRAGDRIVQRVRVFQYNTKPILEALTMNEITHVFDGPRRAGFTYTTTQAQSEVGEWSPRVEWRENGEVALIIEVVSRSMSGTSALAHRLTRHLQLRAHTLSIKNFQALLAGRDYQPRKETPVSSGHLIFVTVAAFSAMLMYLLLNRRKDY